jgi:dihydroflavonol-4-reductase
MMQDGKTNNKRCLSPIPLSHASFLCYTFFVSSPLLPLPPSPANVLPDAMSKARVCVSGVTGYVAGQIAKDLLAAGYTVHGTARRVDDPARLAHITGLPGAAAAFRAFEADLSTSGSFDAALAGCELAVHCASPFTMDSVPDPQKGIVDPAVRGTLSFLESCKAVGTVRKIVVTSSIAAIADEGGHGAVFDEKVWNEKSSLTRLPYYYSKAQAEKAVWDWAEKHPEIKVVSINPFVVIGPSLVKSLNPSPKVIKTIIDAKDFPGIVDLTFTFVDVRDVSRAHLAALENDSASGRYICANSDKPLHFREIVAALQSMGYKPNTVRTVSVLLPILSYSRIPFLWVRTYSVVCVSCVFFVVFRLPAKYSNPVLTLSPLTISCLCI